MSQWMVVTHAMNISRLVQNLLPLSITEEA